MMIIYSSRMLCFTAEKYHTSLRWLINVFLNNNEAAQHRGTRFIRLVRSISFIKFFHKKKNK